MNRDDHDRELAEMFEEVHRHDAPPPFRQLIAAGRARTQHTRWWPRWVVGGAAAALAAAAAVALLVNGPWSHSRSGSGGAQAERAAAGAARADAGAPATSPRDRSIEQVASSLESWRAPTDFLLDTPGMDILSRTPRLTGFSGLGWHDTEESDL